MIKKIQQILTLEPRWYQIGSLLLLMLYGVWAFNLDINPTLGVATILAGVGAQWVCTRIFHAGAFEYKSALISCLSLCLLMRTNSVLFATLAAIIAVASKFIFRYNKKHFLNPSNFAIVALLAVTNAVWVSPAQWGQAAWIGFLILCLGFIVITRARRFDITIAFFASYAAMQVLRALWLGDPISIPIHRLETGALLIFSFFMISDPRATPDARIGRILFAIAVAGVACVLQFKFFVNNSILWSLAICSPLTILLDRLFAGERYIWTSGGSSIQSVGGKNETDSSTISATLRGAHAYSPAGLGVLRILCRQGRQQII